jgi:SAM-dependent methyltransferase
MGRARDGSAGDVDYRRHGAGYAAWRRPEPRIAARLHAALGAARSVLNVGAGAGSYEPTDCAVTAVEPSASMRAQRPAHLAPAIDAVAEALPFTDAAFEASMSTFSVHQWPDVRSGLREMRRVTRGPVVILSCDPARLAGFWLADYAPEVIATEARRYPPLDVLVDALGGGARVEPVPVPLDCSDGFNEAYYGRPELLLDRCARLACSAWSFADSQAVDRFEEALRADLASGAWDARHGHLRTQPELDGSLVLIIG